MDPEKITKSSKQGASLKVLGVIGEPMNGVNYVRFIQPFHHLASYGFELVTLGQSLELVSGPGGYEPAANMLDGISMLVFPQMVASPTLADGSRVNLVEPLCREARRRGIRIVYSADDYNQAIEEHNPGFESIRGSIENLEIILEHADAFILTTEQLRGTYAKYDKPVHLLPNAIDPAHWTTRPRNSGELRLGWTGSSSHLDDILMILPAIAGLQKKIDFRFMVQGLLDMSLSQQAKEIKRNRRSFTGPQKERAERFMEIRRILRSIRHEHIPFQDTATFFTLLPSLDLDIGICPLLDTPFNRHKSANKFYEYAATKTMTVASHVTPYKEEVSVTVPNHTTDWSDTLEKYLLDEPARETELQRQREFVLAERNIDVLKKDWESALRKILQ